jgi:hypothetical protein
MTRLNFLSFLLSFFRSLTSSTYLLYVYRATVAPDHTPSHTHTHTHTDLYLTAHNTHKRQAYMPLTGIEPKIPASERQLTHTVECAATGIGPFELHKLYTVVDGDVCE